MMNPAQGAVCTSSLARGWFLNSCIRVCLKNSLIRNFGVFCAISASSTLDLALLSLRVSSLNWRKIHSNLRIFLFETHSTMFSIVPWLWHTRNYFKARRSQKMSKFSAPHSIFHTISSVNHFSQWVHHVLHFSTESTFVLRWQKKWHGLQCRYL